MLTSQLTATRILELLKRGAKRVYPYLYGDPFAGATRLSNGLYVPGGVRIPHRPTAIDLFAGCGGFRLGFLQAGWEVLAAVDKDVAALTTYWFNLCGPGSRWVGDSKSLRKRDKYLQEGESRGNPFNAKGHVSTGAYPPVKVVICGDAQQLAGAGILELVGCAVGGVDCVMGGPPCQGFSYGGRRDVHDPRNSLVWEFARLVHEIKPRTFVFENVPGLTTMTTPSGMSVLDWLLKAFEEEGYASVAQKVEDAVQAVKPAAVGVRGKPTTITAAGETVQLSLF